MVNVTLETGEERVRLIVEDPAPLGFGQRAEFDLEVCPSPLCHCRVMTFVERARESAEGTRREFALDPFARRPGESDPPPSPESARLAQQVARAMSIDGWQVLAGMFMSVKARAIAEIDCERELASFPLEEVERDGLMVSYRETIPFDQEILVTDGRRELLVDEHHCIRPGCGCSKVVLLVDEIDRTRGSDAARAGVEVAALRVDHRRRRWLDDVTGGLLSDEGLELRRLLLARYPDLLATLGRHQALLRKLYRTATAAAGGPVHAPPAPLAAAPGIGRNDLCPCGSGKKYKKCCGRR